MINFDKQVMPPKDSFFLLGFSGGADSLAALHFLVSGGWNVEGLHIRHFDTVNSQNIQDGVKRITDATGLPIRVYRADRDYKADSYDEKEAYEIRHHVLTHQTRFSEHPVILAHHLNDLAEGYFMNCMQGFPDRVPLVARNGNKVRPFLRTKKKDFLRYLEGKGLTHLIVPDSMLSLRGKLRDTVFPTLQDDWTSAAKKLFVDTGRIYETQV